MPSYHLLSLNRSMSGFLVVTPIRDLPQHGVQCPPLFFVLFCLSYNNRTLASWADLCLCTGAILSDGTESTPTEYKHRQIFGALAFRTDFPFTQHSSFVCMCAGESDIWEKLNSTRTKALFFLLYSRTRLCIQLEKSAPQNKIVINFHLLWAYIRLAWLVKLKGLSQLSTFFLSSLAAKVNDFYA